MSGRSVVFISYSRGDQKRQWLDRLRTHLHALHCEDLSSWSDRNDIPPGTHWEEEIDRALQNTTAIVLLVGPHYLSSSYIREKELPALLRAAERGVPLIPVVVEPCLYADSLLGTRQAFNDADRPLASLSEIEQETALVRLAQRVSASAAVKPRREKTAAKQRPRVLAVMGVRGGVGKGTFVACAAQLLAGGGDDVAIIDYDLEVSGTTKSAIRRHGADNDPVRTVYDHVAPRSVGFSDHTRNASDELWDITPPFLARNGGGRIYLVPSSRPDVDGGAWDVIANVPPPREDVLLQISNEMVERIVAQQPTVQHILIDCGAGTNPFFSAAFAVADYAYIIVTPDDSHAASIGQIRREHRNRYRDVNVNRIFVVTNMVQGREDLTRIRDDHMVGGIPYDPAVVQDQKEHSLDFDVAYGGVTAAIADVLRNSFAGPDKIRIPEPNELALRPWWNALVNEERAATMLKSPRFRRRGPALLAATVVAAAVTLASVGYAFFAALDVSEDGRTTSLLSSLAVAIIALALFGLVFSFYRTHRRRMQTLQQLAALPRFSHDPRTRKAFTATVRHCDAESQLWLKSLVFAPPAAELAHGRMALNEPT